LRHVERLCPIEAPLGEHLELGGDQLGPIETSKHHEDHAREALQIGGEQSCAAVGTKVALQALAGFRDIAIALGSPLSSVKSLAGTPRKVAISPPDAFLQSLQWQLAMKAGSVSNANVTAPQAHRAVYFLDTQPVGFVLFALPKLTSVRCARKFLFSRAARPRGLA
jgi:hypothetical protein